jgi:plasmid maintenance system antidote protein VapI
MVDNLATRLGSRRKVAEAMMVTPSYITNVIDGSTAYCSVVLQRMQDAFPDLTIKKVA